MPQAKGAASGRQVGVEEFSVSEEWKGPCDQDVMSEQVSGKWGEMWLEWEAGPGLGT